jgi:hypothetical protein
MRLCAVRNHAEGQGLDLSDGLFPRGAVRQHTTKSGTSAIQRPSTSRSISMWKVMSDSRHKRGRLGVLHPRYSFALNPHAEPDSAGVRRSRLCLARAATDLCAVAQSGMGPPATAAVKYVQSGWWNTRALTLASGSIIMPSVRNTAISSGCSSSHRPF